ncbi:hypothetical protein JNUCC0626_50270 (plasmid) [Lentzea sp. JNUCC 0626]|uniref:hypothetical protein n=1 Tax=Lentzea sp. JNUCC 0626 TaxID=3367513 RepID=UPI003749DAFD
MPGIDPDQPGPHLGPPDVNAADGRFTVSASGVVQSTGRELVLWHCGGPFPGTPSWTSNDRPDEMVSQGLQLALSRPAGPQTVVALLMDYDAFGRVTAVPDTAGRLSTLLRTGPDQDVHPVLVSPRDNRPAVHGADLVEVFTALLSLREHHGELTTALPAHLADVTREVLATMRGSMMPTDLQRAVRLLRELTAEADRTTNTGGDTVHG